MNAPLRQAQAAFFPMAESPLGLLLTYDAYGDRVTAFIDGDYLRLMVTTTNTAIGLPDFTVPEPKRLHAVASGWPEEWHPIDVAAACRMAADCIDLGWDRFKADADAATSRANGSDG